MLNQTNVNLNLSEIARQAMLEEDFKIDFEFNDIKKTNNKKESYSVNEKENHIADLRKLFWSSIDNEDSRDLDQIEVAEQLADENIRIKVGIADVDALIQQNSELDMYASENTTSVYTGAETFPMLPKEFSEDKTSLREGKERLAIIIDFTVSKDGGVKLNDIFRALVINQAKLNYGSVGEWLDGKPNLEIKPAFSKILKKQLQLQNEAAKRLRKVRQKAGALEFGTVEATTAKRNGEIYDVIVKQKNEARYLIENLMIAPNVLMAKFLESKNYPRLERVVRRPERWQRIVELAAQFGELLPSEPDSVALSDFLESRRKSDSVHFPDLSLSIVKLVGSGDYAVVAPGEKSGGHFGLAVNGYTHSTAPNRRYADLVTQRLVKAAIKSAAPTYSMADLERIAERCNERQTAERKVARFMRKIVAAEILSDRIGETFEAVVTGVSKKGTFVRLLTSPAEGRIVSGEENLDVGDRVTVELINTIAEKGFVDFKRL